MASSTEVPTLELRGRDRERAQLDSLLTDLRGGASPVLVVRGEMGVGKTALLDDLAARATGIRVARATSVYSEAELPFAGLHQLCAPFLDRLDRLPGPQSAALRTVFGLGAGEAPDRFVVGLAVLTLLSDVAEERPLLCIVDDAQWLDPSSAQALAFAARRVMAERVALVFGVREPNEDRELTALPELVLRGLGDADARALLAAAIPGQMDGRVLDRLVAETRGNPLALLELPRGLTVRRAGRRLRAAQRRRRPAVRARRGELRAADRGAAGRDAQAAADRRGRAARRPGRRAARGRGAGRRDRRRLAGRGGRAGRRRLAGALQPSAGAPHRVPVGGAGRPPGGPPRAGRRDRRARPIRRGARGTAGRRSRGWMKM